jgi:MEDS: MEthanogen/methylotroph, DcmR Sensory domain
MTGPESLATMNRSVPSGTHIRAFFSGPAGRDDVVMAFLADGIHAGQLELATPGDAYLRSGAFCTDDMLSYWQQAAAAAQSAKGSGLLRATGEMPSVLNHPDGRKEFFRYEAGLTGFVASLPAVIFCLYDLQRFGAEVLMDTLRTHPMVVVDGVVHDNPCYVDPGEFLRGTE